MLLRICTVVLLLIGFYGCETSGSLTVGEDLVASSASNGPKASGYALLSPALREVANYTIEGTAVDIALSDDGSVAYIASGTNGLEVIDIRDPYHPRLIKSYDLAPYINRVEVKDGIVYAAYLPKSASDYYNISFFDIQNPYAPRYMGSIEGDLSQPHTSVMKDGLLYTVTSYGVAAYDLSAGIDESGLLAEYDAGDSVYALALHGNYLFLANGLWGLTVLRLN